ncbi:5-methyltetrahydropteroyltriglutamate--homocysteine S-methyltransferase [Pseudooceanicola sediminis]|uniref:5-methyltetrahydropteroyltriglutamate--homocysteine S-methyltransferase n=1 Tax=Pseudooceanicola sediminis TaxID=2211117 RepID=A0A399J5L9_9RHOB|nr:5-methyltetrahydropteroyltriglutamate--homocysteine S-methyltransferase [Pseudooceanicola sediminis]KAA2317275.1 5-methyltetrahydropteroyltriglutamate--homocysteine S-methyltransferase [Puniceibacterium sp. HSS470]RII39629.1 5-methyltetrahydropteroyltriglutamate--homocysteine S-methyltransferase [Pseudooceanicola sediminis]|tara:strand:+ start:29418 stop:30548 length:1131 start_codon:yes stop_codon:yes gene_type:complete
MTQTTTTSARRRAPHRADHVGSLLRPAIVQKARADGITGEELARIEDMAVRDVVALQRDAGIKVLTDGEVRRAFWHYDFMGMLDGLEMKASTRSLPFKTEHKTTPIESHLTGPLDFSADHPMLGHFTFLRDLASHGEIPKISIPGPSAVHFRTEPENIEYAPYKDPERLFDDIARTYKKAVQAFYDAGCRYLQLDDIFFAYLGDPKQREARRAMGQDPDELVRKYAWMLEEAIKDRPDDLVIGMHMCRGNFRSAHVAEGGYDFAADAIFNQTSVDVYFMEYDTERAGGLEPLRLLPKGDKRIMAGFITTKTGELESPDTLKAQFDAASKYVDLDQLGIAPQCGFASTEHGNAITEDDEKRKLELVVATAEAIWGES